MPSQSGTVTVLTPPTNSLCTEFNSYQVNFLGPRRFFDNEPFTTERIGGSLQRVCNPDGSWSEKVFFTTFRGGFLQVVPPVVPTGGATVTISDTAPSSPNDGDLWWDSVGGNLYIWYNDGNSSQWVITNNALVASTASLTWVVSSDTPPANPFDNMLWWDSIGGQLYIRYNDGNSSQWVAAGWGSGGTTTTPPPAGGGTISTPGGGAIDTPGGGAVDTPAGGAALAARVAELEREVALLKGSK